MAAARRVTVHFGQDGVSDLTLEALAEAVGTTAGDVEASIAEAVRIGFLTPRVDGGYDATIPYDPVGRRP